MQIVPELGIGGAEVMVENLTLALMDEYNVCVVSLYNYRSAITQRLEAKNVSIFFLGKKKGPDIKVIFRLYKLFKREKPDVIHTHRYIMPYTIIAAILANIPVRVHTVHNIAKKEVPKIQVKVNRLLYKYCNVIPVCISPQVKKTVIEEYRLSDSQVPMIDRKSVV